MSFANASLSASDVGAIAGHSINDRMIDRLERMYDEAQSDHEREVVGSWIDRIRNDTRGQQY